MIRLIIENTKSKNVSAFQIKYKHTPKKNKKVVPTVLVLHQCSNAVIFDLTYARECI